MSTRESLLLQACRHLTQAASADEIATTLTALSDWHIADDKLIRLFRFSDYHQTLAFVNAIAEIIHKEDHHPELIVGYNRCEVRYDTHSVNEGKGGMSANDFICAAKIDAVFDRSFQ